MDVSVFFVFLIYYWSSYYKIIHVAVLIVPGQVNKSDPWYGTRSRYPVLFKKLNSKIFKITLIFVQIIPVPVLVQDTGPVLFFLTSTEVHVCSTLVLHVLMLYFHHTRTSVQFCHRRTPSLGPGAVIRKPRLILVHRWVPPFPFSPLLPPTPVPSYIQVHTCTLIHDIQYSYIPLHSRF